MPVLPLAVEPVCINLFAVKLVRVLGGDGVLGDDADGGCQTVKTLRMVRYAIYDTPHGRVARRRSEKVFVVIHGISLGQNFARIGGQGPER